jgi:hypothetical protein
VVACRDVGTVVSDYNVGANVFGCEVVSDMSGFKVGAVVTD